MTNENIVKRLRDRAERAVASGLFTIAYECEEAADEIEYLRQRCEQIDQEWRQMVEDQRQERDLVD